MAEKKFFSKTFFIFEKMSTLQKLKFLKNPDFVFHEIQNLRTQRPILYCQNFGTPSTKVFGPAWIQSADMYDIPWSSRHVGYGKETCTTYPWCIKFSVPGNTQTPVIFSGLFSFFWFSFTRLQSSVYTKMEVVEKTFLLFSNPMWHKMNNFIDNLTLLQKCW